MFKNITLSKELDSIDKVESNFIKFLKQLLFKNRINKSLSNLNRLV